MSIDAAPAPDRLEILVGYACNNRCRFCSESANREAARAAGTLQRTTEEILHAMRAERARNPGCRHLTLLGGEPTIHRDFPALVRDAFALGFDDVLVTTNGRMLASPGFAARTRAAGRMTWNVSIHGPDGRTHDALTRAPGSFAQAVAGARAVAEGGGVLFATTTVVRPNLRKLPATVRLLRSLGARHVHVAFARPMGAAAADLGRLVPRLRDAPAAISAARAAAGRTPIRFANLPLCAYPVRLRRLCDERLWSSPRKRTVVKPGARGGKGDRFEDVAGVHKTYGSPCDRCGLRPECEGVWAVYARRFGFGDCRPTGAR